MSSRNNPDRVGHQISSLYDFLQRLLRDSSFNYSMFQMDLPSAYACREHSNTDIAYIHTGEIHQESTPMLNLLYKNVHFSLEYCFNLHTTPALTRLAFYCLYSSYLEGDEAVVAEVEALQIHEAAQARHLHKNQHSTAPHNTRMRKHGRKKEHQSTRQRLHSTDVGEGAVGEVERRGERPGGSRLALRLLHRQPRHLRRRRRGERSEASARCGGRRAELSSLNSQRLQERKIP